MRGRGFCSPFQPRELWAHAPDSKAWVEVVVVAVVMVVMVEEKVVTEEGRVG